MLEERTYAFHSPDLNDGKHDHLKEKAENLRDFRNEISQAVCADFQKFMFMSKFDWVKHFRTRIDKCNNQDISNSIEDVYTAYDNKRKQLNSLISVKIQDKLDIKYYKKNGKSFKKGDLKSFEIKKKTTTLTTVATYLVKYPNVVDFIKNEENKSEKEEINKFRELVLAYVDKHGDRLLLLATRITERLREKIFSKPIEFASLSFNSCTEQLQNIIVKNKRTTSEFNAYIVLPGQAGFPKGKLIFPTKLSRKHHGSIQNYYKEPNKKGQVNISYNVCFERHSIKISLTRKKEVVYISGKTNIYGVDVNVKSNLFCDKYENTIDFDREVFMDYIKFLEKCDKKLQKKKKQNIGKKKEEKVKVCLSKKDEITMKAWLVRMKNMYKRKANELVMQAISLGKDHIIMEDLGEMGKSHVRNELFEGFKYSRLIKLLNLADLKNIVASIATKKGVQTTFVQPHNTSKGCQCGCISSENRKTQENFKCILCLLEMNADAHSCLMIEDRFLVDVLRESLLDFDAVTKQYKPKKRLKKSSIKNILQECYDNIAENGQQHLLSSVEVLN